jgi:hypothetical protein
MEGSGTFDDFVRAGLERLGIELDPAELAVIRAAESIYGAQIDALMRLYLGAVPPEHDLDLSRPPEPA